ncbi:MULTISPECIES: xanthine phosphoribosyltransferase [unclassified Granulicatella]|uniref:xanthine phosphoribosyltransferase n=1 Tax=unclassified Granulicatella TaxID=2630493 RepID=UPI0010732349|nr:MULTISPECIES: xanthine phosphoribosyltransferase [unclassified Granulicatella]MBF0780279.1 xanthine phosphoribosyltransferase [Granulicatella sp. 19428wC4_WM01]TFU95615.1 xanthine phosphoribosyltransferase [Granulicatella sp. WM01]
MELLKEMVLKYGKVYPNNVLKVDSFVNHQIDAPLMKQAGDEFYRYFKESGVTKVLTIEASGIAPAIMTALSFGVPMVFAKKTLPSTLTKDTLYSTEIFSYTKNVTSKVILSKEYLSQGDRVLIIDDFLANGGAVMGLDDIVKQAGATTVGVGILIEKSFQEGRKLLEQANFDVHSLCRIASLDEGRVTFE